MVSVAQTRVAFFTVLAMVRILRFRFLSKLTATETSQMRGLYVHESPFFHASAIAAVLRGVGITCSAELAESILHQGTEHREGAQLKWRCFERLVMALKFRSRGPVDNSHEGQVAFSASAQTMTVLYPRKRWRPRCGP